MGTYPGEGKLCMKSDSYKSPCPLERSIGISNRIRAGADWTRIWDSG